MLQSEGELENNESLASQILKMLSLGEPLSQYIGRVEKISIAFAEYSLEIVRSGKFIFIIKRKLNS
ncbi:unnamed protein product [Thelazia callipaeda]|uniref:CorC_HlyC domain-containing protein n=1 Tax=Thelazia callipaeda TaxID=103827 RepID=A0A0N5D911_THECL|nr:unnamed protein product [Thelazia callipaeda]